MDNQNPSSSNDTPKSPSQAMKRVTIGFNVVFQILIFTAIIGMVNYVNFRHFKRWDLSRNQKFALAPLTKNLLSSLKKPVKAIVFFPSAQIIAQDVTSLLREYEYASDKKLSVELVDPYRNLLRAKELSEKYKFGSSDNIVILDYEGRSKFINAMEMAEMDNSQAMFGQPPTVRAFKGEEALTAALLELTEEKQNKLYFLSGHGELTPNAQDLAALKTFIERENIKLDSLNLNNTDSVPAEASAVVILGPRTDLSEREIQILGTYWTERKGRLLVLLGANAKTPRLNEWLASQGITPQQDVVLRNATMMAMENGQPVIRPGTVTTAVGVVPQSARAILKDLVGFDLQLAGLTQSLLVDPAKAGAQKIRTFPLLTAPSEFWGETEYVPRDPRPASKDPAKDHIGPLTLAIAAEKGGLDDPKVKVETSRMLLVGNAAFASNDGLRVAEAGLDLLVNGVNWLVNREQLAGIAPKAKRAVPLSLNEKQMGRLALCVMGVIPCLVALVGVIAWWKRRA
ncbi:MAG: hypothetical protein RLZZ244_3026 [Verrucomicrobiota bacterium]|jgi:hypothetical protein